MKVKEVADNYGFSVPGFISWLKREGIPISYVGIFREPEIPDGNVGEIARQYREYQKVVDARNKEKAELKAQEAAKRKEEEREKDAALSKILITSGFSFDGYKVKKYSGYISGDDVIQISRGRDGLFASATDVGSSLSAALVKIRRNALKELKEAAFDLGCNAVIGVDFDYITLDPETANLNGGTTYLPYVFCVTANGNAVIIEKDA